MKLHNRLPIFRLLVGSKALLLARVVELGYLVLLFYSVSFIMRASSICYLSSLVYLLACQAAGWSGECI